MPGGGSKPGERRGGRKRGTPNKVTADIKAACLLYSDEMLKVIVSIARNAKAPHAARLAAAKEIWDRAHGKAPQHVEAEGTFRLEIAEEIVDADTSKNNPPAPGPK